jgi:hypothetical protein
MGFGFDKPLPVAQKVEVTISPPAVTRAEFEALDKRVAALDSIVRKLDADVASLMPQHAGLEPYPEPPQPAPVERHGKDEA